MAGEVNHRQRQPRAGERGNAHIERKRSSSALPSITRRRRHTVEGRKESGVSIVSTDDPTDDLLEAAGRFCSGGPLLAIALAVFDHLVLTSFLSSLILSAKTKTISVDEVHFSKGEEGSNKSQQRREMRVYNVAWDAATEYFESIAQKFEGGDGSSSGGTESIQPSRSKSTNNLDRLNPETSMFVLRNIMAIARRKNNVCVDVTLLPADAHVSIFSFLRPEDLLSFTCTSQAARTLLDDSFGDTGNNSTRRGSLRNSSVHNEAALIWKALFIRDFSWVMSEWKIGQEAFMRSMTSYQNQGLLRWDNDQAMFVSENGNVGRIIPHLLSTIMKSGNFHASINNNDGENNETAAASATPPSSMKEFYFTFADTWLDYTIAGCNNSGKCLIGLHGHVFDISHFVEDHPGSTETLLLQSGRDATVFFESMGHSVGARKLATGMCAVIDRRCVRWDAKDGSISFLNEEITPCQDSSCGLISPTSNELGSKKIVPGFLIPRKRSKPRQLGGLFHIRERLKAEKVFELNKADRWGLSALGPSGLFGGVHVYYDPFCSCWKWWYTGLDFHPIFAESVDNRDIR